MWKHESALAACALCAALALGEPLPAQRGGKQTARDLFYAEAGLIVAPEHSRKGRFGAARQSTVAVALGLKYRLWKWNGAEIVEADPAGPFAPGDQIRLGFETNDTGYLYVVRREADGQWRRLFPAPEIEHGSHFIHSGVTYPVPPEEGLKLEFPGGVERIFVALSRAPLKDLAVLVSPPQPENTVSAQPAPAISDAVVERVRSFLIPKELVTENASPEKAVYVVSRSGRPDSLIAVEIRFGGR
ncbi:MAG TPA: DUF4384 domain-containing protein [Bryobacterales bacterium]|nr:DUF4384 domain-containing protein [Bryobacterales bacterium]